MLRRIAEPIGPVVQIGTVDLIGISQENDLRFFSCSFPGRKPMSESKSALGLQIRILRYSPDGSLSTFSRPTARE